MGSNAFEPFKYGVIVLSVMLILTVVSKLTCSSGTGSVTNRGQSSKQFVYSITSVLNQIRSLHLAAAQDSNPILSLIHASYALGHFYFFQNILLRDLSKTDIEQLLHVNVSELQTYLENDQQRALKELQTHCPHISLPNVYAVSACL